MGCVLSRKRFVINETLEGQDSSAYEIMTNLGFSPTDIDLLYTAFWDIDADSSGLIRPEELFAYFEVEGTPFEKRIFALFDEDKSGVINFLEFVCTLWNILTLPQSDCGTVAYLLREPTGKGSITYTDVRILLEMLHNRKLDKDPMLNNVFQQMKRELDVKITLSDFNKWASSNPSIMAPLTMLQLHLRLQIIGESFWVRLSNQRKNDVELGRLDYCKRLQESVMEKNRFFQTKLAGEEAERKRLSRIGKGPIMTAKGNIARKESELLSYFQMKPKVKKLTRVHVKKETSEVPAGETKILYEDNPRNPPASGNKSRTNSTDAENNRSRGHSLDAVVEEGNGHVTYQTPSKGLSSKKVKPMIIKYDQGGTTPETSISSTPINSSSTTAATNKSPETKSRKSPSNDGNSNHQKTDNNDPLDHTVEGKSSEKKSKLHRQQSHSQQRQHAKKKKRDYLQLVSKPKARKTSIFDVFSDAKKWNYDILDENEEDTEDHLKSVKPAGPLRRRRSVMKKPNLVKLEPY